MPSYVIVTETGREAKVVALLAERGVAAFCPTERRRCFTDRRTTTRDLPIFPRYVFIHTDDVSRDFATIRHGTPHVTAFLGWYGRPAPIPEAWLEAMLVMQMLGGFDYTRDRRPKLRVGQQVRVIAGKFAALNYLGVVMEFRSGRAVVDIARAGRVTVRTEALRAA